MKIFWLLFITLFVVLNIAVNIDQKMSIDKLLVTRVVNNLRIPELQREQLQMQKVIKRLAKAREF